MILLAENYDLDLSEGGFASLLGFDKKKLLKDGTNFTGDVLPDITRSVDWVFIHCDLITRRANDVPSDVCFSLSTANFQVSYPIKAEPHRLKYQPVDKTRIDSARIRVTDGRNNPLFLNGVNVALALVIREEKFSSKRYRAR